MGIFIAGLIALAVMAVFVGLRFLLLRENITDRMYDIVHSGAVDRGGGRIELSGSSKNAFKELDRRLRSRGLASGITTNLMQADLRLTTTEYILLVLGITILAALIGYAISRHPVSALVAGVIGFFIPGFFVYWRKVKRRREFSGQLVDALNQVIGSLRAGYSIAQSLDTVAMQMAPPVGDEFKRVVRELQLGQSLMAALMNLAERIKNDDIAMVITAININQQVGGNLAEILETVSETIRERVRIKREIQVLTAQQTISGYILAFLPIILGAILLIINPTYEMRLFLPGPTLCIPIGAGLGIVAGFLAMRKIIEIDV
jgi:tight adherence protein B